VPLSKNTTQLRTEKFKAQNEFGLKVLQNAYKQAIDNCSISAPMPAFQDFDTAECSM